MPHQPLARPSRKSRRVAERAGAADGGQRLLLGTGVTADQNLTFGVEGVSLRGGEIGRDAEGAGGGRLGVGEVWDSSGNGVVDEGGRIGADSSVHNVQIAGGAAVLADVGALYAGQYRL